MRIIALLPALLAALRASALAERGQHHDGNTVEFVATAWYAGWHAEDFPLSKVSWDKYTELTYAFAVTTPDPTRLQLNASDEALLPEFVKTAHEHGVKASLSIGGWTGSVFFSDNVGSAENRTAFVKTVTDVAQKYNLDGIDFDWEYPNRQGVGCNTIRDEDSANFLAFLQQLRSSDAGKKLQLSAAVSLAPFAGPDGAPLADVRPFAAVLDYVAVMNYDVWGSWSTGVGPNAPLNDTCAAAAQQQGSAVSAIKAWNTAGMPRSKIVLGVPAYGHSFTVAPADAFVNGSTTQLAAYPAFVKTDQPTGDKWDDAAGTQDVCGVVQGAGGTFTVWGMQEAGFLNGNGDPADGILYRYDECSQTPYVYNPSTQVMISYDNFRSFSAKGDLIKNGNLRGFALWEAGGDAGSVDNTGSKDLLLDAIRTAAGLNDEDGEGWEVSVGASASATAEAGAGGVTGGVDAGVSANANVGNGAGNDDDDEDVKCPL